MKTHVIEGDISKVKADALITAINSGGMWFGGIDGVINRSAGNLFHSQAAAASPLRHGQVINAKGNIANQAAFANVVFVIDDLQGPLSEIIYNGLAGASKAGYRTVTLPTIRMGVMLGTVEKTVGEATRQMAEGVHRFLADEPNTSIEDVTFVVFRDTAIASALRSDLQQH